MSKPIKVLITGVTGFVGSHLLDFYIDNTAPNSYEIHGMCRWRSDVQNIEKNKDKMIIHEGNMTDPFSMENVIKTVQPDIIHHLAAQCHVLTSFHNPQEAMDINALGTLNILEAVRKFSPDTIVQIAGSSEEYGLVHEDELPIKETNPLRPLSPYAVSKVAADMFGYQYNRSYNLRTIITRAFNHIGPRQQVSAAAEFAQQVAMIKLKKKEPVLLMFDTKPRRDYLDVRDVCRAYFTVCNNVYVEYGDVYNICSEKAYSNYDIAQMMFKIVNMPDIMIDSGDPTRFRPSDVPVLLGNCSKFKKITHWLPSIEIEKTLQDMIEYALERIK